MKERTIELNNKEMFDEFYSSNEVFEVNMVWDAAWKAATKTCLSISLEVLRDVLRDENSDLTYGTAEEIQNRLCRELDA